MIYAIAYLVAGAIFAVATYRHYRFLLTDIEVVSLFDALVYAMVHVLVLTVIVTLWPLYLLFALLDVIKLPKRWRRDG